MPRQETATLYYLTIAHSSLFCSRHKRNTVKVDAPRIMVIVVNYHVLRVKQCKILACWKLQLPTTVHCTVQAESDVSLEKLCNVCIELTEEKK
jgi:hypothetical protein